MEIKRYFDLLKKNGGIIYVLIIIKFKKMMHKIEKKLIYAKKDLKMTEKHILFWLNDFGKKDKNKEIRLTYQQIADAVGITHKSAWTNVKGLIDKGYISKKNNWNKKKNDSSNGYTLLK